MDTKCGLSAAIASDPFVRDLHSRLIGPSQIALPSVVESLFALYGGRIGGLNVALILGAIGDVVSLQNTRKVLSEMESLSPCLPMPSSLTEAIQRAAYTRFKWDREGLSDVLCAISALVINPDWFSESTARIWRINTDYPQKQKDSVEPPLKTHHGMALYLVKTVLESLGEVRKDKKIQERWMQSLIEELLKQNWKEVGVREVLLVFQDLQSLGWSGSGLIEKLTADMHNFSEAEFLDGLWSALTGVIEYFGSTSPAIDKKEQESQEENSTLWISVVLMLLDGIISNGNLDSKKNLLQEVAERLRSRFMSAPFLVEAILQGMTNIKLHSHDRHNSKATEIWLLVVMDAFLEDSNQLQGIDELLKTELGYLRQREDELQAVLFEIDSLSEFHMSHIMSKCFNWINGPACLDLKTPESVLASLLKHPTKSNRVTVLKEIAGCLQQGCSEEAASTVFSLFRTTFDVIDSMSVGETPDLAQTSDMLCLLDKSLHSIRTCIPTKSHPDLFKIAARISCWVARYPMALLKTILAHQNGSELGKNCPFEVQESIVGAVGGLLKWGFAGCLCKPPEEEIQWMHACLRDLLMAFSYEMKVRFCLEVTARLPTEIGSDVAEDEESYWIVLMVRDLLVDQLKGYIRADFRMKDLFAGDNGCEIAVPIDLLLGSAIKFAFTLPWNLTFAADVGLLKIAVDVMEWLISEDCCKEIAAYERGRKIVAVCSLMRLVETLVDTFMCDRRILEAITKHIAVASEDGVSTGIVIRTMIASHRRLWKILCTEYKEWRDGFMACGGLTSEEFVQWGDVAGDFLTNIEACGTEHVAEMVRACVFGDLTASPNWTVLSGKGASELLDVYIASLRHGGSLGLPMLNYIERMVHFVCNRDETSMEQVELILTRSILLRKIVETKAAPAGAIDKDIQEALRLGTILHIASAWISHVQMSDIEPTSSPEATVQQLFPNLAVKESVIAALSVTGSLSPFQTMDEALEKHENCSIAAILLDLTIKLVKLATFKEKTFIPLHLIQGVSDFAETLTSYAESDIKVHPEALFIARAVISVMVGCDFQGEWTFHGKYLPIVSVAMELMDDIDATTFACTALLEFVSGDIELCPWAWIGRFRLGKGMDLKKGFVFSCPVRHRLKIVRILFEKLTQRCFSPESCDSEQAPNPAHLQMEASSAGCVCCVLIIADAILGRVNLDESVKIHTDVMEFLDLIRTNYDFIADTAKSAGLRWKQLNSLRSTVSESDMGKSYMHSALIRHIAVVGSSISTKASTIFKQFNMEAPCENLPKDMEFQSNDHKWLASLTGKSSFHTALSGMIDSLLPEKSAKTEGGERGFDRGPINGSGAGQGDSKSDIELRLQGESALQTPVTGKKRKKRAEVVPVTPKQGMTVRVVKQSPESMIWRGPDLGSESIENETPIPSTPTRQKGGAQPSDGVMDVDSPVNLEEKFDSPQRGAPTVEFVSGQKLMECSSSEREREEQKNKKPKRARKKKAEEKEKHAYIAAVLKNDRCAGYRDEDNYSDLEDFIVPSKDKDYEKLFKKMYTLPTKK
ncbi:hypothetical protein BSKO_13687 [Bryopsis sp. KO-2023]|nr:hypothetical protein BSKO_13687 [Bryopsis sp. KO-2023]